MQKIKALIVDDETRIRRGIERLLHSCGEQWEVVASASDGLEALHCFHAAQGDIDLLITDVKMPEMDGLTLIKEAKKQYSFYALLISGYDDFAYLQSALREGALDYLLKPIDREQFRQRMREVEETIMNGKYQHHKREEWMRGAGKLAHTRQLQTLSYMTSMEIDTATLGYWVDEFPEGMYSLLYIRMDTLPVKTRSYKASDWKAYFFVLENIMGELLDNEFAGSGRRGWCWRGAESDFWMLLFSAEQMDWEVATGELSAAIRSAIQKYTPFTVSVAYGEAIEDLYLLPDAKRQAVSLMNYRFQYGGNQTFRPSVEKAGMADATEAVGKNITAVIQKLKRCVEQGDSEEALAGSRQLFKLLDEAESPSYLQTAVQTTLILLHSIGLENQRSLASATELPPIEEELHRVTRATNLHELKQGVNAMIARVIAVIRQSREGANARPIELAKQWMLEHLEQELTIKKIADHVFLNPTYFSELFKQQTGETVLDYLTGQRMNRAKELLRDHRLKLQDVCERVGYHDVKYFSRLFKQWTGQTPSKYRESEWNDRGAIGG